MDQLSKDLASLRMDRDVEKEGGRSRSIVWKLAASVLGVAAIGVAAFAYGPDLHARMFRTEVHTGEISMVSPAQASISVTTSGHVVAQNLSRIGVKSPGRVAGVHVKQGDVVEEGELLLELEDAEQKSSLASASARITVARSRAAAARASLEEVKQQIERERTLVEREVRGKATLEDLEARLKSLEEQAKAADAEARAAAVDADSHRVMLENRKITAPIAGTVITEPPKVGELVGPTAASIIEIADFTSLIVETDVPEARLHLVQPGSPCEVVLEAYPSKRYRGATLSIGSQVNRAKATVPVKVEFVDPMDGVLPGMSARTSFLTKELDAEAVKEPARRVAPSAAVIDRQGNHGVFVVEADKARFVAVQVGQPFGGGVELLAGPSEGTRVVLNPPPELVDGQGVKVKEP